MPNYKKVKVKQHASNYSSKPKRSFGQKLKNFFTIPEEDLKEEESPKFERIKLFRLNRRIIFLSILVFMLIINLLIGFDVNFLYLRQILGFLFIILIPGLLIMLCFKIRTVGFWEYLVYTVGLSVAFIMFAGLAVNWTLPALNITDKPLSLWPILICFNIFLLILWFIGIHRNKDLKPFDITVPKLDTLNNIFFIIPMAFPLLSILGAFLLNNHGPNILTMIMLGGIAVYVLFLVIFRKHMDENIWPWALYWMGLALLFMFSMRSWYISGMDINLEYSVFQLTKSNSYWDISNFNNAYNAMLSITIFPVIYSYIININEMYISKIIFSMIFSIVPIIIFLSLRRYPRLIIPFLASFFFISQPMFIKGTPNRQEIAFIFFGLMLLVLFTKNLNPTIKKVFFVIFGASMIVSHYSTAYMALFIFLLTYILILIYKIYEKQKIKKRKIDFSQKSEFYLTGALILLLLIFGFLWYNQVTPISNDLIDFADRSISNIGNIFEEGMQIKDQTILGKLNFLNKENVEKPLLEYNLQIRDKYNIESEKDKFYNINYSSKIIPITSSKTTNYISPYLDLGRSLFRFLGMVFIIIGFLGLMFIKINKEISIEIFILVFVFLIILSLIILLPFSSIRYDTGRTYQQSLLWISFLVIFGLFIIFKSKKYDYIIIASLFLIFYFLFLSNFLQYFSGGYNIDIGMNNIGYEYDTIYVHREDISSANWLYHFCGEYPKYADAFSLGKITLSSDPNYKNRVLIDIIPEVISKKSYVYSSYLNVFNRISFRSFKNVVFSFGFPTDFLNDNKNKIYDNGGSEIFR